MTAPLTPAVVMHEAEGRVSDWQKELDGYYQEMKRLQSMPPDQIFLKLASWSARASEIRTTLVRHETRREAAFRTREIDPFLEELDRQFRIYSRVVAVNRQEWDMAKGY